MSRVVKDNNNNSDNKIIVGKELNEKYFPHHPKNILRMNNGSFGACPNAVLELANERRQAWLKCPDILWGNAIPNGMGEARTAVAKYVAHCDVEDIVVIENVTVASTMMTYWLVDDVLKLAIDEKTMTINPGPYVILTTNYNYNAVKSSHEASKKKLQGYNINLVIEVVNIPFPLNSSNEIENVYEKKMQELNEKYPNVSSLRLVYLDHIISNPCMILPVRKIADICKKGGFNTIYCDGAHSPGYIPNLEVQKLGCDFYASNLHKWSFAPTAAAFLFQHSNRHGELHHPIISHNYGFADNERTRDGLVGGLAGESRMMGTRDYSAMLSIPDAIQFYLKIGGDQIAKRNRDLAIKVSDMLSKAWETSVGIPHDMIGCMVMVGLPEALGSTLKDAAILRKELQTMSIGTYNQIMTQFSFPANGRLWMRISVAAYNHFEEYEIFRDAINEIVVNKTAAQFNF